jgi:putative ABC transport system substrate-binding protein
MIATLIHRARRAPHLYLTLALLLQGFLWAHSASAQTIAVVKSRDLTTFDQVLEGVVEACPQSSTWEFVEYNLNGKKKRGADLAHTIRQSAPKFILALGPLAAQVSQEEFVGIPVLYCMVANPHRYDLTGTHIGGISLDVPGAIQFARYKAMIPNLHTLGVIYDPQKSEVLVAEAAAAAAQLGLELVRVPVSSHKQVPEALRAMLGKIDALWTISDDTVLTTDSFRFFLLTSFEHKLPFLAISDIFVKVGALATLAPQPRQLGHQICDLMIRIEAGEIELASFDVMPPLQAELVVNAKTAEKIGLILPQEILQSAGKVYK